jgi:glycosyltransferase involved in cell wall biosynthesis
MPPSLDAAPHWFCAQIGAREHYAIPRALHQSGRLAALYTDFWAGAVLRKLAVGKLRSLANRFHPGLTDAPVVSWNIRSLSWENDLRRRTENNSTAGPYLGFIQVGRQFAVRVRSSLQRRTDLNSRSIFFAYDTGALEAFEWCRERGIKCVLNQMDPDRVEVDLVRAEEKQWPGWTRNLIQVPEEYFVRRKQEWALADRIVVNSDFSRRALLQQGVPPEKLAVIPLCFEAHGGGQKMEVKSRQPGQPLRVLFLGQVILRKGIQYLLATARSLEKENIRFDVVGPVGISPEAVAAAPANVVFHGRTSRDQAAHWYQNSHVFVLPTISDGFAITQLEAMAHGLPVVTTPCCGEVVSDAMDGFVVPPRDSEALVQIFKRYLDEPDLLSGQSAAALVKARQFTSERLTENLRRLEADLQTGIKSLKT